MIKNWKLFLESNSRDQEILDNIRDILISLKVDHYIRVLIRSYVEEIGKVKLSFVIEGKIGIEEVQTILHLDSYLKSEEFEPHSADPGSFLGRELNVIVQRRSGQLTNYPISILLKMLTGLNKNVIDLTRIDFQYNLPDYLRFYNDKNGNIFKIGDLIKL
jgi:hypothetical protein